MKTLTLITLCLILEVTDEGTPPLTRYTRIILDLIPVEE